MSGRTPVRTTRRSTRSPQPQTIHKLTTPSKSKAASVRPPLPTSEANSLLKDAKGRHSVKTQELKLNSTTSILIARMKMPTPAGVPGHLIKRFDTDAISASTFFRVAFPTASAQAEEDEMSYLRSVHNCVRAGNEDSNPELRLTGTWIPTADAGSLADLYGIKKFASELIAFENPFAVVNFQDEFPSGPDVDKHPPSSSRTNSRSSGRRAPSPSLPDTARVSKRARMTSPRGPKQPAIASSALPVDTSADASSESAAPAPTEPDTVIVTVTSVSHDPATGDKIETTTAASLVGSDEQVAAAREEARELLANLQDAAARNAADNLAVASQERKRSLEEDIPATQTQQLKRGLLRRIWRRRHAPNNAKALIPAGPQASDRVSPETRRSIALFGLAVASVAAGVLPYVFQ